MSKSPVLFLAHGSPMNAIEQNEFTRALKLIAQSLVKPQAVLVVSAHWVTKGTQVLASEYPRTIHDFRGFPEQLTQVNYPAPGAPLVAQQVIDLLSSYEVTASSEWGLDHGTWSVLRHMWPQADVPVLQLSIDKDLDLEQHFQLACHLSELREQNILVVGSGNITHNLALVDFLTHLPAAKWAQEFDEHIAQGLSTRNLDILLNKDNVLARKWSVAHPTLEHYIPLIYALGASSDQDQVSYPYLGFQNRTLSMRCVKFG